MVNIIISSFIFHYYGKIEMITNYKYIFGLKKAKVQAWPKKQMPSQREQYGSNVRLFIGTGRSPCKITSRPFAFDNDSIVIYRGLDSLFLFKSVSSFPPTCRSFLAHSFGSVPSFILLVFLHTAILTCTKGPCPKVPVHVLHSRNIVKSHFWGHSEAEGPQQ
jgi:hypothetical protein